MLNNVIPPQSTTIMEQIYLPGRVLSIAAESFEIPTSLPELHAPVDVDRFDTEAAMDAVVALESLRQNLLTHDKLNQTPNVFGINAVNIAIESISHPFLKSPTVAPLLENKTGMYVRHSSLKISLESVSDNIKRIVAKIVAWIRVATRKVAAYLTNIFKGADAQARKAASINAAAVKAKPKLGTGASKEDFNDSHGFVTVLGDIEIASLAKDYTQQMKDFSSLFDGRTMVASVGTIRRMVQEMDKASASEVTNEDVAKLMDDCISFLEKNAFRAFHGDDVQKSYALKVGGASLKLAIAKSENYKTSVSVALDHPKNNTSSLKALTIDEIVELTNAVTNGCKKGVFPDYSQVGNNLSTLADDIERLCDRIVQRHSVKGGEIGSLHMLKQVTHCLMDLARLIYSYNIRVSAAINEYCAASLKALEKEHGSED